MSIGIGGIIGAILGFLFTRSIFGSLIGYFIGSSFDRVKVKSSGSYQQFRDRFNRAQYASIHFNIAQCSSTQLDTAQCSSIQPDKAEPTDVHLISG